MLFSLELLLYFALETFNNVIDLNNRILTTQETIIMGVFDMLNSNNWTELLKTKYIAQNKTEQHVTKFYSIE